MIYAFLYLVIEILAVYSAYKAIMETRTAQGAIAWSIFLLSFPLLGLPLYWIFGRNKFVGYQTIQEVTKDEVLHKVGSLQEKLHPYTMLLPTNTIDVVKQEITVLGMLHSNRVSLLVDGNNTFSSILHGLKDAKKYILFQFYIIDAGELASEIQSVLLKKAQEGVAVYILYDELGSGKISSVFANPLLDVGVKIVPFNTTKGWYNSFQLNFRNHRKTVVVDGEVCWIGGHNVGDEYINKSKKFSYWRDTHVRIDGPAAIAAQLSFAQDWHWATDGFIEGLCWEASPVKDAKTPVLVLPTGPADKYESAKLFFVDLINSAKKRVWIATPYFVPDEATMSALQLAGLRGVDVRILIPDKSDHLLIYFAAFAYFEDAEIAGVKFYRYTKGFTHQKVVLVDDDIGVVGTANFDNRSFRLNFEISAVVHEDTFCKQLEAMLEDDFQHSILMTKDEEAKHSFAHKFIAKVARLTAPVL